MTTKTKNRRHSVFTNYLTRKLACRIAAVICAALVCIVFVAEPVGAAQAQEFQSATKSDSLVITSPNAAVLDSDVINVCWKGCEDQVGYLTILLSTDQGKTFGTVLAAKTENDGQQLVALPKTDSATLRIKIQFVGSNLSAQSPADFRVRPCDARIFIVRHCEKEAKKISGRDPNLTQAGKVRAALLGKFLGARKISKVYSTNTRRTRQTGTPTATAASLTIQSYSNVEKLVAELRLLKGGQRVLVVGHSNTAGKILQALGHKDGIPIQENEYDNMFVVHLDSANMKLRRFRYGTPFEPKAKEATDKRKVSKKPAKKK